MTARLRDLGARSPVTVRLRLGNGLAAAHSSSLCEDAAGPPVPVEDGAAVVLVPPAGTVTLGLAIPGTRAPGTAGSGAG